MSIYVDGDKYGYEMPPKNNGEVLNDSNNHGSLSGSLTLVDNNYIFRKMKKIIEEINNGMQEKDATILDNAKDYTDDALCELRKYIDKCYTNLHNTINEEQEARDYETNERINILAVATNDKIEQYLKIMNTMSDINKLQDQRITRVENNTYKRTLIYGGALIATLLALITSTIVLGTKVNTLEHQVSAYETQIISEENTND